MRTTVELMQSSSYDDVQMRDVASAADAAIATVYRYFTSKDHLAATALLEWSGRFPTMFGDRLQRPASPR